MPKLLPIKKFSKSGVIAVSKLVRQEAGIGDGDYVKITASKNSIIITKTDNPIKKYAGILKNNKKFRSLKEIKDEEKRLENLE